MRPPYEDISFTIVVWNDAEKLDKLLAHVRPWFKIIGVCVQESPDDTLEVAKKYADVLVTDKHRGYGDASYGPHLLTKMREKWTLRVDSDEWPTEQLLENLGRMVERAEERQLRGVWVPFRSWVDDAEWAEDHAHLRLFQTAVPWPPSLHSRPMIEDTLKDLPAGDWGCLEHRRSLDKMVRSYLVYYDVGRGNKQWDEHNKLMMREACLGAADHRGWDYVKAFDWWPNVVEVAFGGKEPEMPEQKKTIYVAGTSSSGTRLVYDWAVKLVAGTNRSVTHASIPGYRFGEIEDPVKHPVWWDRQWMEDKFGEGNWVIVRRDQHFAALSSERRGFVKKAEDYEAYAAKGNEVLDPIVPEAYVLQYEDIVKDPQGEMDKLAAWLERPKRNCGTVYDGNAKYPPKPEPKAQEPQDASPLEPHAFVSDRSGKKCIVCRKTPRAKVHQS